MNVIVKIWTILLLLLKGFEILQMKRKNNIFSHPYKIEEIFSFLSNGYVINNKNRSGINIFQIYFVSEENKFFLNIFDYFGRKKNTFEISKEEIIKKISFLDIGTVLTYHKKRTSKKKSNTELFDEEDVKIIVYEWLIKKNPNNIIIPEISFGENRVDLFSFNNKDIISIEIKSEIDNLNRLEKQLKTYLQYSTIVWIAVHTSHIEKIKKISFDDRIGILEINQNFKNKIKVFKRSKKIKNNFLKLFPLLYSEDFLNMKKGLKQHSKYSTREISIFFDMYFSNKKKNDYIYHILLSRFFKESEIRKKYFYEENFSKSISSCSNISFNRMTHKYSFKNLVSFFDIKNNFLVEVVEKEKKKILSNVKSIKYFYLVIEDPFVFRYFFSKNNIPYTNHFSLLERIIDIQKNLKFINSVFVDKNIIEKEINSILSKIKEVNSFQYIIHFYSKSIYEIFTSYLNIKNISFILLKNKFELKQFQEKVIFTEEHIFLSNEDLKRFQKISYFSLEQDKFIK